MEGEHDDYRLNEHANRISCIAVSDDEALVATGASDGSVRIWGATGLEISRTPFGTAWVDEISFHNDGDFVRIRYSDEKQVPWYFRRAVFIEIPESTVNNLELPTGTECRSGTEFLVKTTRSETALTKGVDEPPVAWWPERLDCTSKDPARRLVAGSSGDHLIALRVEGAYTRHRWRLPLLLMTGHSRCVDSGSLRSVYW